MHDTQLIATIAIGFGLAFVFGYLATRLKLPPLVGYLVAGIFAGPFTPGIQADAAMAGQLAEVGIILLMFGVGLHFSIGDLLAVKMVAIPGALLQIGLATAAGMALAHMLGWSVGAGLVFGLSLSVASTVVLLKALEGEQLNSAGGRVAVGWLIVEDLAMVLALVLLPAFAETLGGHAPDHGSTADLALPLQLALTLGKVAVFVALAIVLGPKVLPWLLGEVARTGSRELFTLSVLALALGIAFASAKLFGVSFALGAFFAGVVLSESHFSHRAAAESLPLQDAFSVLFFVSIGMLFDPTVLIRNPLALLATLAVVIVGKGLIAFCLVTLMRYPIAMGIRVAAGLAQIGEFSFILVSLGTSLGLLPTVGRDLILAAAILSITLHNSVMAGANGLIRRLELRALPALPAGFGAGRLEQLESALEINRQRVENRDKARRLQFEELLETFPLLRGVDPGEQDELLLLFHPKAASPGTRVMSIGDRPDGMYFIASGRVDVDTPAGSVNLGPGAFFGEMALLDGTRRKATITAVEYCRFLVLERRDFDLFMTRHPVVEAAIRQLAAEREAMNQQSEPAEPA